MAGLWVDGIEDPLTAFPDIIHASIVIQNPVERLLRRRDVVAMRTEADDGSLDFTQVEANAVAGDDLASREFIADEQIVDHPLHRFAAQHDKIAPPFFELQIAVLLLLRI